MVVLRVLRQQHYSLMYPTFKDLIDFFQCNHCLLTQELNPHIFIIARGLYSLASLQTRHPLAGNDLWRQITGTYMGINLFSLLAALITGDLKGFLGLRQLGWCILLQN